MRHSGPFKVLAETAGRARMEAVKTETARHQALAEYAELSGMLERVDWLRERCGVLSERSDGALRALGALEQVKIHLEAALYERRKKNDTTESNA